MSDLRILVFAKPRHPEIPRIWNELRAWLEARGYRAELDPAPEPGAAEMARLAIVLGGDGTMLHVAHRLALGGIPVLAVHLGTLGFLAETPLDGLLEALEAVLAGRGVAQRRALLEIRLERAGLDRGEYLALNEAVVAKGALARIIRVALRIDGEAAGDYRADGLVIATPTGSTAYSFSAGGAVMHPGVEALIVTPICPHSLRQRPLVVGAGARIEVRLEAASDPAYLTIDGQRGVALEPGDRVRCHRSPLSLTLMSATGPDFYQSLRSKLHWG